MHMDEPCFHPCTDYRLVMKGGFCMTRQDTWRRSRATKAQLGGVGIKHTKVGPGRTRGLANRKSLVTGGLGLNVAALAQSSPRSMYLYREVCWGS